MTDKERNKIKRAWEKQVAEEQYKKDHLREVEAERKRAEKFAAEQVELAKKRREIEAAEAIKKEKEDEERARQKALAFEQKKAEEAAAAKALADRIRKKQMNRFLANTAEAFLIGVIMACVVVAALEKGKNGQRSLDVVEPEPNGHVIVIDPISKKAAKFNQTDFVDDTGVFVPANSVIIMGEKDKDGRFSLTAIKKLGFFDRFRNLFSRGR